MIKSIAIKNYQSHIDTTLDLCTGVNVITGASDAGKSSIVRAFEWNRINRPLGNSIKNWNAKEEITSVDVEFIEGIITQKTLADTNKYTLKIPVISKLKRGNKYQETSFSALNKEIPEEIIKAFDMNDVNVQPQHEKYFMLDDSPGIIAQKLNELAGLDIIDRMFKNINSFILHDKRINILC